MQHAILWAKGIFLKIEKYSELGQNVVKLQQSTLIDIVKWILASVIEFELRIMAHIHMYPVYKDLSGPP